MPWTQSSLHPHAHHPAMAAQSPNSRMAQPPQQGKGSPLMLSDLSPPALQSPHSSELFLTSGPAHTLLLLPGFPSLRLADSCPWGLTLKSLLQPPSRALIASFSFPSEYLAHVGLFTYWSTTASCSQHLVGHKDYFPSGGQQEPSLRKSARLIHGDVQ